MRRASSLPEPRAFPVADELVLGELLDSQAASLAEPVVAREDRDQLFADQLPQAEAVALVLDL